MKRLCFRVSTSSFPPPLTNPPLVIQRSPLNYQLIQKYSKHQGEGDEEKVLDKERAPSTAEIMDELSQEQEEDARTIIEAKSKQGFVSQTSDKMLEAAEEAISGDSDPEDLKEIYKRGSPGETYHKPRPDCVGPTGV